MARRYPRRAVKRLEGHDAGHAYLSNLYPGRTFRAPLASLHSFERVSAFVPCFILAMLLAGWLMVFPSLFDSPMAWLSRRYDRARERIPPCPAP